MTKVQHKSSGLKPVRRAVLRGLGLILPTLLTIIFILWVCGSVQRYVLSPIESLASQIVVSQLHEPEIQDPQVPGRPYVELISGEWVPKEYYDRVVANPGDNFPTTAKSLYDRYVHVTWFRPQVTVTFFLCLLIAVCYLLGKLVAARIGVMIWTFFERLIDRLPLIRTVYSTMKQVTDIVFAESDLQYTRVVAVQYPREGLWSVGFVTGESLPAIHDAFNEPVISVLMPTSPMPATGFTISVRRSEVIELDITVDQAFQFVVSCGVVSPGMPKNEAGPIRGKRVKAAIEAQVNA